MGRTTWESEPRGRSGSDSHAVRTTHRRAGAIADQVPAARPLYQSLDRPANPTRQARRRMPGAEYAVLSRDGGPRTPELPGRQYLVRTATDRLVSVASAGVSFHDTDGFGDQNDTEA